MEAKADLVLAIAREVAAVVTRIAEKEAAAVYGAAPEEKTHRTAVVSLPAQGASTEEAKVIISYVVFTLVSSFTFYFQRSLKHHFVVVGRGQLVIIIRVCIKVEGYVQVNAHVVKAGQRRRKKHRVHARATSSSCERD
jgi:hypothetical protein